MAKVTLGDVGNLLGNPTSAANRINQNNDFIEQAFENTLSRDGTTPNQMESDIDLNNNDILNVRSVSTESLILNGSIVAPDELQTLPPSVMAKPQYDPNNIGLDVFNRENHYGLLPISALDGPQVAALLYELTGFSADGVTDDTFRFTTLESTVSNKLIDMQGRSYRVSSIPSGNIYVNGFWVGPFENWEDANDLTQVQYGKFNSTISGTSIIVPSVANSTHYVQLPTIFGNSATPLYVSAKIKAQGYDRVRFRLSDAATGTFLTDAVFGTDGFMSGSFESLSSADGSGYRVAVMKFTIPVGYSLISIRAMIQDLSGQDAYAGNGTSGFELSDMKFGYRVPSLNSRGILSSTSDTGGQGLAYAGGIYGNQTVPGRTTPDLMAVIASQSSRAAGPSRAGVFASIYSMAMGNVSAVVASRHSQAWVPQSVVIASEECGMYSGFRGVVMSSIASRTENESNLVASSRSSHASGRNSVTIAASGGYSGRGGGWRGEVTYAGGAITAIRTARDLYGNLETGRGYLVGDAIFCYDRLSGSSDCVASVGSIDSVGGILTVTVSNGGTGYGTVAAPNGDIIIHPTVDNGTGDFSANIATSGYTETSGVASAVIASGGSDPLWIKASGSNSFIAAAGPGSVSSGQFSSVVGGFGVASGTGAVVLSSNSCNALGDFSISLGRGSVNPTAYEISGGYGPPATPLSSNRKWSASHQTGVIKSVTTFSASGTFTDYAEYFENYERGVIPLGTPVMLKGRKVLPWDGTRRCCGVVSGTAAYVAGDSQFAWAKQYLTGKFGERLVDEDGQFVVNPEYDPTRENTPRSERPEEFSCVGLVGQLHVRVPKVVQTDDDYAGMYVMDIIHPYDDEEGYAVALCYRG